MNLELLNPYQINKYPKNENPRKELKDANNELWIDAVTDRTQADVDRVIELTAKGWDNLTSEEQAEWLNGLKGALNVNDLERVQNNIQLLSDVIELNLAVSNVPALPDVAFYEEINNNVAMIRKNTPLLKKETPIMPKMPFNTYAKWNQLEHILKDVYDILRNNFYNYCNDGSYCGSDFLI